MAATVLVVGGWAASNQTLGGTTVDDAGKAAPDFSLERLDERGTLDRDDAEGHVLVLNFWASWCGPCEDEVRVLENAWRRWSASGVRFIGVASRDRAGAASAFAKRHGITFPVAIDPPGNVAARYGVGALPQTFVVSPSGDVLSRTVGPVDGSALDRAVRRALGKASS